MNCFPGGRLAAFRSCWDAPTLEDIAHGLIADLIAQMSQGTRQAVVAPAAIFLGHLDDQIFKFFLDTGTSRRLALVGAIEFVSGEFALPGEDGIRFDDLGDFFQGFLAELFADLGQGLALGVCELHASLDLIAQDAVFCREILVSEQEFFIDRARNIGQHRLPIHVAFPPHESLNGP